MFSVQRRKKQSQQPLIRFRLRRVRPKRRLGFRQSSWPEPGPFLSLTQVDLSIRPFDFRADLLLAPRQNSDGSLSLLVTTLGWFAAFGGGVAAVVYIIGGDDGLFGPAALVTMLSIIVTLSLIGGQIRRDHLLSKYSFCTETVGVAVRDLDSVWSCDFGDR